LTKAERDEVVTNCDHLARLRFSPVRPRAFTEHGAVSKIAAYEVDDDFYTTFRSRVARPTGRTSGV